ncbi:hypothetical protein E2C01_095251 [Portunus trituberculatus]|uniref:Uncharacterized protein n=1 Tax=Portunus trituberculatus TaxID=210409 RepID=A0A5B7JPB9_PORTR|nr:hypothetical protein [Portunus trituberculatus]
MSSPMRQHKPREHAMNRSHTPHQPSHPTRPAARHCTAVTTFYPVTPGEAGRTSTQCTIQPFSLFFSSGDACE